MEILFIVGSLRERSFNKQLALKTKELIGDRATVSFLDYKNIPFMNQDLEADLPESIKNVKEEVLACKNIWIFTPEYNGMVPGVLKNLLDWLSRPMIPGNFASGIPIKGKNVAVSGVGGRNATAGSREQLLKLLKRINANVMETPCFGYALPPEAMKSGDWTITEEEIKTINEEIDAFLKFINENN